MDWLEEWWQAALENDGFWHREQPADHFLTSVGNTDDPALTAQFAAFLDGRRLRGAGARLSSALAGVQGIIDLGAGDGALLRALARLRPDLARHGVDVRPAPGNLPPATGWSRARWDVRTDRWTRVDATQPMAPPWSRPDAGPVLVVAHEWLDDLPCRVAGRGPDGWELLGPDGPTGQPPDAAERAWLDRWAGDAEVAEVGLTRDRAWARVAGTVPPGSVLLAIDYGHLRSTRPRGGALLGYRSGRLVAPRPDGRTNITAPVAVDSLAAAVEQVSGVRPLLVARQAEVVGQVGATPPQGAGPAESVLAGLVAANRRRVLADPTRFGANWWIAHHVLRP